MNLRQLQYFYEASRTENFAKVAEKFIVPPSAVSVAIKHLEQELGAPLFDRSANKIKLNEQGRLFADELQLTFRRMEAVTRQIAGGQASSPRIKVLIRARPKWITELIAQFKEENPEVDFVISNDYTISAIDEFDIVIDEDGKQYGQWARFLLSTEIICVKAAATSPLVGQTLVFADLQKESFVLPSPGNGMRNLYERTCKKLGIDSRVTIECNDRQCLQYYVQANMGLTLGAHRALTDNTKKGIAPLKVTDFNETQSVYVFYRKTEDTWTKVFCDVLYNHRYL